LDNSVVIFDEAHNIEQVCEDAASVSLTSSLLASAIEYVRTVCEVVFNLTADLENSGDTNQKEPNDILTTFDVTRAGEDKIRSLNLEKLLLLKGQLIEFERLIDALEVSETGLTKTSDFLVELLGRAGITSNTKEHVLESIEEILSASSSAEIFESTGTRSFSSSLLFPLGIQSGADFSRCFRLYIKDEPLHSRDCATEDRVWDSRGSHRPTVDRTLSYWCLSPGRLLDARRANLADREYNEQCISLKRELTNSLRDDRESCAMQDLVRERVRCVILTSGTLYPVEPIEAELRMKFDVQLKNPHVIKPDQVRVTILTRGSDGQALSSTYASREKQESRASLGLTLRTCQSLEFLFKLCGFADFSIMFEF
uniref:DEAD_2 domain-containing protein n=1 Tax=Echinostoma caproni TaxID=27848 RepID=A0A183AU07_9TREM